MGEARSGARGYSSALTRQLTSQACRRASSQRGRFCYSKALSRHPVASLKGGVHGNRAARWKIASDSSVRRTVATSGFDFTLPSSPAVIETRPWPRAAVRALEILPGAVALFLISYLIWGYVLFPGWVAATLLVFDAYWLWKSWTIGYHVIKGTRIMRRFQKLTGATEYEQTVMRGLPFNNAVAWEDVRHVVIIPNYKESESKLRQTLTAMAATLGARENVIPVLAMEEAEAGAALKAQALVTEFAGQFHDFLVTYHPYGLPGEVRGKSSNEAWAAKETVADLCERRGLDINHLTVTSCDADTLFPPQYFECLTYHFATDPRRYRRFWQAPIFFYNNIWQVPAPLRVPNAIAGLVHLCRLSAAARCCSRSRPTPCRCGWRTTWATGIPTSSPKTGTCSSSASTTSAATSKS